jgi:cellulose synthase/poly-beta-1,6-N-acetylglucosamine synthase-like glycosyltransferase
VLNVVETTLLVIVCMLGVPVLVFAVECLAASLLPRRRRQRDSKNQPCCVTVLMPAHNEELGIEDTIATIKQQMKPTDRILVVADNCTDSTAAIASSAGAEVIERHDTERTGKGYALAYGVNHLASEPPDVLVVADADCLFKDGALADLASAVCSTGRPVQARYVLDVPNDPSPADYMTVLAFRIKNQVRFTGLARFGLPCLLTGTGMAFPWNLVCKAKLDTGNIVEDMQLGIDLAIGGSTVVYCDSAVVTSTLPQRAAAKTRQKKRWEHGHLQTLITQVPKLVFEGLRQRRLQLLAMALDIAVPPLSLLVMLTTLIFCASLVSAIAGASYLPCIIAAGYLILTASSVLLSWLIYARDTIPASALFGAPFYALRKIPLYLQFAFRRERSWVRTERTSGR